MLYLCYIAVLWIAAAIADMRFFRIHEPGMMVLYILLWGNLMVLLMFTISKLFERVMAANIVLFIVMFISIEFGRTVAEQLIMNPTTTESAWTPLMFWPLFLMLRGSAWLSYAAFMDWPITYDNWTTEADGAMPLVLGWMTWEGVFLALLLYWLEGVAPPYGTPKAPLFFLDALPEPLRKLCGRQDKAAVPTTEERDKDQERYDDSEPWDVREERERVQGGGGGGGKGGPKMMIEIHGMRKEFEVAVSANAQAMADGGGGQGGGDGCCAALIGALSGRADGSKTKLVAVKNMNLAINAGECFGLLGHSKLGRFACRYARHFVSVPFCLNVTHYCS